MLGEILALDAFRFIAVFTRMGMALMYLPGFSADYVPRRARLMFALGLSLVLVPVLEADFPAPPKDPFTLGAFIAHEATVGLFIGLMAQMLMSALELAGNKAAMGIGLGMARAFNPVAGQEASVVTSIFGIFALTLIFVTDMHHMMIGAAVDSYSLFPPQESLPIGDFVQFMSRSLSASFHVGFQLSAPLIVFTIVFHTGMGLIARLMPELPIFFLTLPMKLFFGLGLLMIVFPIIMMGFIRYFGDGVQHFLSP